MVLAFVAGRCAIEDASGGAVVVAGEAVDAIALPSRAAAVHHDVAGRADFCAFSAADTFFRICTERPVRHCPHKCRIDYF